MKVKAGTTTLLFLGLVLGLVGCSVLLDFGEFHVDEGESCDLDRDCDDDGVFCTEERCIDNYCESIPREDLCTSVIEEPCVAQVCDPDVPWSDVDGCAYVLLPAGHSCEDTYYCTTGDECDGMGGCVAGAEEPPCEDGVGCTEAVCYEAERRCELVPRHDWCPTGERWCVARPDDGGDGGCRRPPVCSGSRGCDDGIACNGLEHCDGAVSLCRAGDEIPGCAALSDCAAALCESGGDCRIEPRHYRCYDGDPCTVDICNPSEDCEHMPAECRPGIPDACCPRHCTEETDADCVSYEL